MVVVTSCDQTELFLKSFTVADSTEIGYLWNMSIESNNKPDLFFGILMNNRVVFAWKNTPADVFRLMKAYEQNNVSSFDKTQNWP